MISFGTSRCPDPAVTRCWTRHNEFPPPSQAGPSDNWRDQVACPRPLCNHSSPQKTLQWSFLDAAPGPRAATDTVPALPHSSPHRTALGLLAPIALSPLQSALALPSSLSFLTAPPNPRSNLPTPPWLLHASRIQSPPPTIRARPPKTGHSLTVLWVRTPKGTKQAKPPQSRGRKKAHTAQTLVLESAGHALPGSLYLSVPQSPLW